MSRRKLLEWVAGLVTAALCSGFIFFQLFLKFPTYDDEGYMLSRIGRLLNGISLYDTSLEIYGPLYYLVAWLTHGLAGVPLTSDAARFENMAYWLATAALCGLSVWRLTGRPSLTLLTFVAVVFQLQVFRGGNAHPQALACVLMALFAASACNMEDARFTGPLAVCSAAAGALVFTKVNLGIFASLALVFTILVGTNRTGIWKLGRLFTLAAALSLPWLLMRKHLEDRNTLILASIICWSTLWLNIVARRLAWNSKMPQMGVLLAAFMVPGLVACGFMVARGTTPFGLLNGIILRAASLGSAFYIPFVFGRSAALAGLLTGFSLLLLVWPRVATRLGAAYLEPLVVVAKASLALFVILVTFRRYPFGLPGSNWIVASSGPLVGLALIAPFCTKTPALLPRLAVGSLALFEVLMVYPVAGAQMGIGTFLFIPVAAFCLADALSWLEVRWKNSIALKRLLALEFPLAFLLVTLILLKQVVPLRRTYDQSIALALPGAQWLRLDEYHLAVYRWLAVNLTTSADTFLCNIGLNSLFLWTGLPAVSVQSIGNAPSLFTDAEQVAMVTALGAHPRGVFVYHAPLSLGQQPSPRDRDPLLVREVRATYQDRGAAGGYHLLTLASQPPLNLLDCGWWTGANTFQVRTAPRPGVRLARLSLVDTGTGREVASTHPGLEGQSLVRLTGDLPAIDAVQDLTESCTWSLRIQPGLQISSAQLLVIRLYDPQGECLARLPFLDDGNNSEFPTGVCHGGLEVTVWLFREWP